MIVDDSQTLETRAATCAEVHQVHPWLVLLRTLKDKPSKPPLCPRLHITSKGSMVRSGRTILPSVSTFNRGRANCTALWAKICRTDGEITIAFEQGTIRYFILMYFEMFWGLGMPTDLSATPEQIGLSKTESVDSSMSSKLHQLKQSAERKLVEHSRSHCPPLQMLVSHPGQTVWLSQCCWEARSAHECKTCLHGRKPNILSLKAIQKASTGNGLRKLLIQQQKVGR